MKAEAASLMQWLSFYATHTQEACISILLRILKLAFPAASHNLQGWEAVVATIEGFYETSLNINVQKLEDARAETLQAVLELVLAAVVQCEAKETFVKDILTMEDAVQANLMVVIERVMSQGAKEERKEQFEKKESSERNSPLYLSRNAALERAKQENQVLKEENIHLGRELEYTAKKLREVESEKEKMVAIVQQLKKQMDTDGLRRERSLHAEYDGRIQMLQLQLDSLKTELDDKTVLASQVPALRDEVDLLRPVAEKAVKAESALVKYKAKIDKLSGANETLQRLKDANTDLVNKVVALESEVAKAASWQRKLKEAKESNTIVESRVSELEEQLFHKKRELALAHADLEAIQSALHETKTMNVQLQESNGPLLSVDFTEDDSSSSMASGISEFNPELMQKLTRLECENAALKNQVNSETSARIDGLLDKVDDLTRLKKSFERKYFDSQQALQSTKAAFNLTKTEFEHTVVRLQANAGQLREWQLCLQKDVTAHALDKQSVVAERNRLAAELCDGIEEQHHLTRALSSQRRELLETQKARESLECQNGQLVDQCESLSRRKEALETKLARLNECAAMQIEDANAEQLRFQQQKTRELDQAYRQHEKRVSDIMSSMTLLVDAKSAEIGQLTSKLHKDKLEHDADRQRLVAMHVSASEELKRYQQQYSVSNTDWNAKEEELKSRIEELNRLCSQCAQQELALKSTIKSQLQSNARLVAKLKAVKTDAVDSRKKIAMLENTAIRLESKVALLEKERSHVSAREERKRDMENGLSSYTSQLSTQVTLVVAELEKVLKENKKLHMKQSRCHCGHESPRRGGTLDSVQKINNHYMNRIQQMEHDQQQVEHKRRELLLVNAKLIQEQKQLHLKTASLSYEVHKLEESVNHWRLCDERRRKKGRQRSLSTENIIPCAQRSTKDLPIDTVEQSARQEHEQKMPRTTQTKLLSDSKGSPADFSLSLTHQVDVSLSHDDKTSLTSNKATSAWTRRRKRILEEDCTAPKTTTRAAADSSATSDLTNGKAFSSKSPAPLVESSPSHEPRSKRRLSHFITHSLVPDKSRQDTEKPSECKQQ